MFIDRLLATLVHLRHGVTHDVLACWLESLAPRSPGPSGRAPAAGRARLHRGGRGPAAHPGRRGHSPEGERAGGSARCHRGAGAPPGGRSGRPAGSGSSRARRARTRSRRWWSPTPSGGCCSAGKPARAPSTI
ncbi:transposase family protein [Geodermatophilus maliterrae]|uniref:Transposase family protein n=1 Tax=Geodermatophilus maliterrae TaxID=3162531 RepID=A0ABV3XKE5_9ACTN